MRDKHHLRRSAVTIGVTLAALLALGQPAFANDAHSSNDVTTRHETSDSADVFATLRAPARITDGSNFHVVFGAGNLGDGDATGVVATLTLPDGMTLRRVDGSSCSYDAPSLTCRVGTLAEHLTAGFVAHLTAIEPGRMTIKSRATQASFDPSTRNNTASKIVNVTQPLADLAVTIDDVTDPVAPGGSTAYVVKVANRGTTTAEDVVVKASVPAARIESVDRRRFDACAHADGLTCSLSSLAAGAHRTFSFAVAVPDDARGSLTATASATTATPESGTANNAASETTTIRSVEPVKIGAVTPSPRKLRPTGDWVPVAITYDVSGHQADCSLRISSNQGDASDWRVLDDHRVLLRAERAGHGARIYRILVTCVGDAESSATAWTRVIVSAARPDVGRDSVDDDDDDADRDSVDDDGRDDDDDDSMRTDQKRRETGEEHKRNRHKHRRK